MSSKSSHFSSTTSAKSSSRYSVQGAFHRISRLFSRNGPTAKKAQNMTNSQLSSSSSSVPSYRWSSSSSYSDQRRVEGQASTPLSSPPSTPQSSRKRYSTPVHHRACQQEQTDNAEDAVRPSMLIPPYSPTYCKPNEFPYSNFYMKLPNGQYLVRYRSGNREILGYEILEEYMIWQVLHPRFSVLYHLNTVTDLVQ